MEHSYCILPESSEAFWELADFIDISDEEKNIFRNSSIEKVYINADCGSWDIIIKVPELLSETAVTLIAKKIKSGCQLKKVEIKQYLNNNDLMKNFF